MSSSEIRVNPAESHLLTEGRAPSFEKPIELPGLTDGLPTLERKIESESFPISKELPFIFIKDSTELTMSYGEVSRFLGKLERIEARDGQPGFSQEELALARAELKRIGANLPEGSVTSNSLFRAKVEIATALREIPPQRMKCEVDRQQDIYRERPRFLGEGNIELLKMDSPWPVGADQNPWVAVPGLNEWPKSVQMVCKNVENSLTIYFFVEKEEMVVSFVPKTLPVPTDVERPDFLRPSGRDKPKLFEEMPEPFPWLPEFKPIPMLDCWAGCVCF